MLESSPTCQNHRLSSRLLGNPGPGQAATQRQSREEQRRWSKGWIPPPGHRRPLSRGRAAEAVCLEATEEVSPSRTVKFTRSCPGTLGRACGVGWVQVGAEAWGSSVRPASRGSLDTLTRHLRLSQSPLPNHASSFFFFFPSPRFSFLIIFPFCPLFSFFLLFSYPPLIFFCFPSFLSFIFFISFLPFFLLPFPIIPFFSFYPLFSFFLSFPFPLHFLFSFSFFFSVKKMNLLCMEASISEHYYPTRSQLEAGPLSSFPLCNISQQSHPELLPICCV